MNAKKSKHLPAGPLRRPPRRAFGETGEASRQGKKAEPVEDYKNKYLRALADFDNYKKRAALDKEQFAQFANETLISELLPILDGFGRAIDAAKKINAGEEMLKGLALIKRQLEDVLKKHGAKEIEALGKPYDPNLHEAMLQKEDDGPEGIIIEEAQKGYTLHERVIRPSMVIVSKNKGE